MLFVVVPLCNLVVPAGSVFHVSDFMVTLIGKIMCYAIVALAMDLIWGYTGILSLGHGLFFALGGYAMGMYLMRSIGHDGVYKSDLPDFMVFLDWKAYPWYWSFTDHFWYCALLVVLVPGFSRSCSASSRSARGSRASISRSSRRRSPTRSCCCSSATTPASAATTASPISSGSSGFPIHAPETRMALFMFTGAALIGFLFLGRAIVSSKLGRVLTAIRDAETRVMFSGYNPVYFKLFIWTLCAVICGIAGALYVPQVGIINPSEMSPANSIEIAIWTAVGGRGTLIGPVIGAAVVNLGKSWFTQALPEYWLFALGLLFILVTLYLPRGIAGLWTRRRIMMNLAVFAEQRAREAALVEQGNRHQRRTRGDAGRRHQPWRHPLSRFGLGQLRRLQGVERPDADRRCGRAAVRHRAQRRRQDHDDGRHHRQDPPGLGHRVLRADDRPHPTVRTRDRRHRHRPQIPEADGIHRPHGVREPRARQEGRQARVADAHARSSTPRRATASSRSSKRSSWRPRPGAWPACCRTARSSGSRSACCSCRSRNCCCSTSRWPA